MVLCFNKMDVKKYFTCEVCKKKFSNNRCLRAHLRKLHQLPICTNIPGEKRKYKCPDCGLILLQFQDFKIHVLQSHNVNLEMHFYKFQSQSKFVAWKKYLEERDVSCYVYEKKHIRKRNYTIESPEPVVTKSPSIFSYNCHRSGYYNPKPAGECNRKRRLKAQGSSKINAYCPSKIIADFRKKGTVKVIYCSTHMGHKPDASHIRLTLAERNIIAEKIVADVPFDVILDEMRTTVGLTGNSLTRKQILSRHDLFNIQQSIILNKNSGKATSESGMVLDKCEQFNEEDLQIYNPDDSDSEVSNTDNESDIHHGLENKKPKYKNRGSKKMRCSDKKEPSTVSQLVSSSAERKDTMGCSFQLQSELNEYEDTSTMPKICSYFSVKENHANIPCENNSTGTKSEIKIKKMSLEVMKFELVNTFCETINKLETTEEIKWVKNHIHSMFDLLKTLKFSKTTSCPAVVTPKDCLVKNSSLPNSEKVYNSCCTKQESNTDIQMVTPKPKRTSNLKKNTSLQNEKQLQKRDIIKQSVKPAINDCKTSFNSYHLENKILIAFTKPISPSETLKVSDQSQRQFSVVQAKDFEPFMKNLSLPVPPLLTKSNELIPPLIKNINATNLSANISTASSIQLDLPVPPLALIPKEKNKTFVLDHDYCKQHFRNRRLQNHNKLNEV